MAFRPDGVCVAPALQILPNATVNPSTALVTASFSSRGRAPRQFRYACGGGLTHAGDSDWATSLTSMVSSHSAAGRGSNGSRLLPTRRDARQTSGTQQRPQRLGRLLFLSTP